MFILVTGQVSVIADDVCFGVVFCVVPSFLTHSGHEERPGG